jgi:octaprenyl-diphosphate synthase
MEEQYTLRLQKIEAELARWLPEDPDSVWKNQVFPDLGAKIPEPLLKSLTQPAWDLVNRGGKRWRPLLMILICESLGGGDAAIPLTPLVEFCHNASLIHDDIEDSSDERRGKPAVHLIYGEDSAINSGCFLYFLPLACIEEWGSALPAKGDGVKPAAAPASRQRNRLYKVWGEYMRRLHLGQAMDIHWHRDFLSLPSFDEYRTMCGLKTGCLARLAACLGVYAVPSLADDQCDALAGVFGGAAEKLGVGFQILDDVKNLSAGLPGKKRGDDIVEGKKSLPILLYLHRYPERREFAARCFTAAREGGTSVPEVASLTGELEKLGILKEAEEQGLALIKESKQVFTGSDTTGYSFPEEGRALIAGLVDYIS